MTYREIADRLGIERVCVERCGLSEHALRGVVDGFDILHWRERRVTRRGLRRFLLLAARRKRLADESYLNDDRKFGYAYLYWDARQADLWAAELGIRFPVAFSRSERLRCLLAAPRGLARRNPAMWAWARKAAA